MAIDDAEAARITSEKNAKDIEHLVRDLSRFADALDTLAHALWSAGVIEGDTANTVSDLVKPPGPGQAPRFSVGERVRITAGEYAGAEGVVTHVSRGPNGIPTAYKVETLRMIPRTTVVAVYPDVLERRS